MQLRGWSRAWSRFALAVTVSAMVGACGSDPATGTSSEDEVASSSDVPATAITAVETGSTRHELPLGGYSIFPEHILVAYYGTATTPTMGVLGEDTPARITKRLRASARPYAASGWKVQIVYELIVTIADPTPGADGDYSHDIAREHVERYVRASRRNKALLVLDLQPGRSDFLTVAKRWRWALRKPWVGLALDPEWRMGPGEVPGRTIGSVRAAEVNRVSRWLQRVAVRNRSPEKVFMLHQFRRDMVVNIENVADRRRLETVQHVDGFGTPSQKLATYRAVMEPSQFAMGFKLFYDEDTDLMSPERVLAIRPRVRFVSYQ